MALTPRTESWMSRIRTGRNDGSHVRVTKLCSKPAIERDSDWHISYAVLPLRIAIMDSCKLKDNF
jgi:hypothetical protein